MREAQQPQTTFYPCRPLAAAHLSRHALVAPREHRGGPPRLKIGPHREPCLLSSGPPQPRLATWRPSRLFETPSGFESRAVRPDACRDQPPQGHAQLARERDHSSPAESATAVAKALLRPRRQRTRWRNASPAPGNRNGQGAEVVISGFGDATRIGGVPTGIGRGG
jgi:hypothetical protein